MKKQDYLNIKVINDGREDSVIVRIPYRDTITIFDENGTFSYDCHKSNANKLSYENDIFKYDTNYVILTDNNAFRSVVKKISNKPIIFTKPVDVMFNSTTVDLNELSEIMGLYDIKIKDKKDILNKYKENMYYKVEQEVDINAPIASFLKIGINNYRLEDIPKDSTIFCNTISEKDDKGTIISNLCVTLITPDRYEVKAIKFFIPIFKQENYCEKEKAPIKLLTRNKNK